MWLQLGCQILLHTGMQIQPQASSLCSIAFSLRLTNGASEVGTRRGKPEIKVSPVSLWEGLCCIAWFHEGIAPSLSTKAEDESYFLNTDIYSVCIYTYKYMHI